jgi:hypothetical protein
VRILKGESIHYCIMAAVIKNNLLLKADGDDLASTDLGGKVVHALNCVGLFHLHVTNQFSKFISMLIDDFSCG